VDAGLAAELGVHRLHRQAVGPDPAVAAALIATAELYSSLKVMFTPAATAARTARLPECVKVPSPMFCTRCRASTNGAIPIQVAPSPPI
jgi:hypothetical protein